MKINYTKDKLWEYLPEFMEELKTQLIKDDLRWGDTWKKRPIEGQEERMKQSFNDYMDRFENANQPFPTLKAVGGLFINWVREYEKDNFYNNLASDLADDLTSNKDKK